VLWPNPVRTMTSDAREVDKRRRRSKGKPTGALERGKGGRVEGNQRGRGQAGDGIQHVARGRGSSEREN
jgi:hypothetical protein